MRVAVVFLLLCEAFDVRSHLGHTLLAVFRRGKTELLDKCAVEGARSIEADQRADLGNAERGVEQISASLGHAQGLDVIIEAKPQSTAEQVGNIKLVEVEFFFQKREGKVLGIILRAKRDDGAQGFGISHREL